MKLTKYTMKYYFLNVATAAILLVGCNSSTENYIIEGKATNPKLEGRTVYMQDALNPTIRIDSVKVTNGKFKFEGKQAIPVVRELMVQENDSDIFPITLPFVLENGRIEVDLGDRVYTGNTKLNDEMMEVLMEFDRFYERDFSNMSKEDIEIAFAEMLMVEITKHSNNIVGKYLYEGYKHKLSNKQQANARQILRIEE